jgi:hypothetical protein
MSEMQRRAADKRQSRLGGQEASPGFTANGEGEWTRHAAQGGKVGTQPTLRERQSWSRLDLMIGHEEKVIARVERRLLRECDPKQRARDNERLRKLKSFVARLRAEQQGAVT